jgi:hypothetical protein
MPPREWRGALSKSPFFQQAEGDAPAGFSIPDWVLAASLLG